MIQFSIKEKIYFFCLLTLILISSVDADESKKKYLMAIFGDSISAASLAQTAVKTDAMFDFLKSVKKNMEEVFEAAQELGVGDIPFYENKDTLSWGSGLDISSHYNKLKLWYWKNEPDATLIVKNYAVPGNTTDDLAAQVEKLNVDLKTGQYDALVYVGLTIGSNDACSAETFKPGVVYEGLPNVRFKANLEKFIEGFSKIKQSVPVRILFHSIGKVADLGFPKIMTYKSTEDGLTCSYVRQHVFTYCPILPFWNSDDQYKLFSNIVVQKNEILQSVINESNAKYSTVQAHFSPSMFNMNPDVDILAIDCFHPNQKTQEMISEAGFEDQPWFKFSIP